MRTFERKLVSLAVCVFVLFNLSSCAWTAQPNKETPVVQAAEASVPDTAFTKIYHGDFDGAKKMIRQGDQCERKSLVGLAKVIAEYDTISVNRAATRKTAYEKQLTQLEKYRHPKKTADVNDPNAVKDINDANDPNGLFDALLVVVKAHEVADTEQKSKLLDDPFVKDIIAKSINRCDCFEAKSQWFESLMNCYGRLVTLYADK
ncbi:MAG: hypothetical protein Q7T18_01165, partial [Sedimentisphaerales bacterium]|nr:hypothetical protein [Sedimentisphaerales bacterium]